MASKWYYQIQCCFSLEKVIKVSLSLKIFYHLFLQFHLIYFPIYMLFSSQTDLFAIP